ncbi:MAG: bifunctional DNA primase/polymerase [Planctomycetes bacterium]|nr:bifunctional DNA primase/polymerase [Planctomycetota bacterium]
MAEDQNWVSFEDSVRVGHKMGWSFTPLAGKRPTLQAWQKAPTPPLGDVLKWAKQGNIGLRTGKASSVVVIDVDRGASYEALNLPATITVYTGGGGMHLYYACDKPLQNSAGRLAPHVDVRGDGGQVVYPGSVHPETKEQYVWAEGYEPWNFDLAILPDDIYEALTRRQSPPVPPPAKHAALPRRGYTATAVATEAQTVATAVEGTRNDRLNTAAFNLGTLVGGGALDAATAEAKLLAAARSSGLSEKEAKATIRSGLESGRQHPRTVPEDKTPKRRKQRPAQYTEGQTKENLTREYILMPGAHVTDAPMPDDYIEQSTSSFADEVVESLPETLLYRKDQLPGELLGICGKLRWHEVKPHRMRLIVDRYLKLGKWSKSRKDDSPCLLYQTCNRDAADLVIAGAMQHEGVRDLDLLVHYPVYAPGWTRLQAGWYNGLYYDEPRNLAGLKPERDPAVIDNVLHDLTIDFPFRGEADRQNFFGLLLTPIVAPALEGNRPLHMIGAPIARTGKSKLAELVFGGVILGRPTPAMQITERDEERDKRVIGLLLAGETLVHLDNLPNYVDSAAISSLLTATTYSGRLLGANQILNLPNNLTLVATGNNVQASSEIIKRTVPIILQPTSAHPEERRDFAHEDLWQFVKAERRMVLECLLGMVENWLEAGRPEHGNPLGGFETWSHVIGGILQVNAQTEWRKNERRWRAANDPHGREMTEFVALWWDHNKEYEVTTVDLLQLASDNDMFAGIMAKRTTQARGAAFGKMLRGHVDAPIDEWFVRWRAGRKSKYYLEPIMKEQSNGR